MSPHQQQGGCRRLPEASRQASINDRLVQEAAGSCPASKQQHKLCVWGAGRPSKGAPCPWSCSGRANKRMSHRCTYQEVPALLSMIGSVQDDALGLRCRGRAQVQVVDNLLQVAVARLHACSVWHPPGSQPLRCLCGPTPRPPKMLRHSAAHPPTMAPTPTVQQPQPDVLQC